MPWTFFFRPGSSDLVHFFVPVGRASHRGPARGFCARSNSACIRPGCRIEALPNLAQVSLDALDAVEHLVLSGLCPRLSVESALSGDGGIARLHPIEHWIRVSDNRGP